METKFNVYVDIGNTNIKFGFYKNNKFKIKLIKNNYLNKKSLIKLFNFLSLKNLFFYISSVNLKTQKILLKLLNNLNINYKLFNHNDLNKLNYLFNNQINFNQIGIDLIFACYYLENFKNVLICIFGSVYVLIKKTNNIDGFLFLPNLYNTYTKLLNQINLNVDIKQNNINSSSFGINNNQCFNNSISLLFSNFLNPLITNDFKNINKIIISGGDYKFFINNFNNIKNYQFEWIDNLCIYGIKKFIENN